MFTGIKLNILVACEESQTLTNILRIMGHNAFSLDIQRCSGGHPEYHIHDDLFSFPFLGGSFFTQDGKLHTIKSLDLIVAHPPCTYLARSGSCNLLNSMHEIKDHQRYKKLLAARAFFYKIYNLDVPHICIENPILMAISGLPPWDDIIDPWQFGDPYTKKTCLWLKDLPKLNYTNVVTPSLGSYVAHKCGSVQRSKSFTGIARAMASQYTSAIINGYLKQVQFDL